MRTYVDREGQNRTALQISANHVEFPSRRNSVQAVDPTRNADDELPI